MAKTAFFTRILMTKTAFFTLVLMAKTAEQEKQPDIYELSFYCHCNFIVIERFIVFSYWFQSHAPHTHSRMFVGASCSYTFV